MSLLHASCVAIDGRAVLISGESGAGKSDLALRLIDRGAVLVSDDQVELSAVNGTLYAAAPASIAGKMEIRGIGIVAMSHQSPAPVSLLAELAPFERMPERRHLRLDGVEIPVIALAALESSAPIKVELALREWGLKA